MWDPSMTPVHLENYLKYLWFGQLFNLYGMALIKLSICAYILMLDFSNVYRAIIWLSVIVHLAMNFVFPSVILLGECRPISKHWDGAGAQLDTCWSSQPRVISGKDLVLLCSQARLTQVFPGYSGAATNICTDLVYAIAPLLYISRVQLSRRTLWGVRAVFLLGLMSVLTDSYSISWTSLTCHHRTTIISALKLYEMKSLWSSPDPTYTSVNLSIYAIAEVFVGAFTASLPPLRKTFEDLLRRILPGTILRSSRGTGNTYELKAPISEGSSRGSRPRRDRDSNSEHAILPEDQVVDDKGSDQAIVCTTDISMTVSRKSLSAQPVREWV